MEEERGMDGIVAAVGGGGGRGGGGGLERDGRCKEAAGGRL